jgi:hypothetical protein
MCQFPADQRPAMSRLTMSVYGCDCTRDLPGRKMLKSAALITRRGNTLWTSLSSRSRRPSKLASQLSMEG